MRTTLDIDDDVLFAVKKMAKRKGVPMGKALSELARQALNHQAETPSRNGVPLFPRQAESEVVTLERINQLRD
jgi:hypothetical protein